MNIGYVQLKRLLKIIFVWALRWQRTVTLCFNFASPNFYLLTYYVEYDKVVYRAFADRRG